MTQIATRRPGAPPVHLALLLCGAIACALWLCGCDEARTSSRDSDSSTPARLDVLDPAEETSTPEAWAGHANLFSRTRFPSAFQCGKCHPTQFRQWSASQHSYAQISPIFNAMQGQIDRGVNGTNGDFCIRCHTQPGMILGEKEFATNLDRDPIALEGVTCIVCHRLNEPVGKISGRLPLQEGALTDPVYGPTGRNSELQKAIAHEDLVTNPARAGRKVHGHLRRFFRITTSAFCGACHDVTLFNGFRLEEAFSEYKHSPAAARGVLCQDCHMGKEPGRILAPKNSPDFDRINYAFGPAAMVGDYATAPRKLTNHMFVGPDYSVAPPWLFPHHPRAIRDPLAKTGPYSEGLATMREWIQFDWKAGWGTDVFERNVPPGYRFPPRWTSASDRRDARKIIDDNLARLEEMNGNRLKLLRNGYKLGQIVVRRAGENGIKFSVQVKSGTDGHGVPTGFDVERPVWLHVVVRDATGRVIKESGDLDADGDVRDLESTLVRAGKEPLDSELFSLQGRFVVRLQRGSEREQVLSTNYSPSPLPFLRPERRSSILLGRPNDARKQKNNIEPLGERWANYTVSKDQLTGKPPYTAQVQLKSAMVPANLVREVSGVGFDYHMGTDQIVSNLLAGHRVIWERSVTLSK